MVFATLAFLGAFGADQGLLTYFADLSGPGLPYSDKCTAILLHIGVPPHLLVHPSLRGKRGAILELHGLNLRKLLASGNALVVPVAIQSSWATKVSTIGQQAFKRTEGAEKSQGQKALGINRP